MKVPDKKSDESTSTAAPPASETQAEGAIVKAPDGQSGESASTAAPSALAVSFTIEASAEGAVVRAPDKNGESTSTAAPPKRARQGFPVRLRATWVASVPHKTFAYSDAQWRKIRDSLAPLGIDADAETVPDRWWAHPDPAAALVAEPQLIGEKKQWVMLAKRPLREQLQELAADYRGLAEFSKQGEALTPRQEAAEVREALNKFARPLAAALDNSLTFSFSPHREDVSKALAPFIAHAQRFHDSLMAEGSYSRFNAHKAHIEYWGKLVLWWRTRTPRRRQRKEALSQFLLACTKPAFSERMLQSSSSSFRLPTIESRIASFLNKAT